IRCSQFFEKDTEGNHSELVFGEPGEDGQAALHVIFDDAAMAEPLAQGETVELAASVAPLTAGIEPLLYGDVDGGALAPLIGAGLAATLLGLVASAGHSGGSKGGDHDNDNDGGGDHAPSVVVNPIT